MSIHLDDTLIALCFVPLRGHDDWMAGLNQTGPREFKLTYRMREADPLEPGADPHENIDNKRWYVGTVTDLAPKEAIARMNMMATLLAAAAGTRVFLLVREEGESTEQLMERLARQPWAHMKSVKPGDPGYEEAAARHGAAGKDRP